MIDTTPAPREARKFPRAASCNLAGIHDLLRRRKYHQFWGTQKGQVRLEAAFRAGQSVDHFRETVEPARTYPLADITRHTAEAYGDVKARLAAHYIDLSRRTPRWLEDWQWRGSSKTLQVDENDIWLVAQAVERDRLLVTTDARLAERFSPVIGELRIDVI